QGGTLVRNQTRRLRRGVGRSGSSLCDVLLNRSVLPEFFCSDYRRSLIAGRRIWRSRLRGRDEANRTSGIVAIARLAARHWPHQLRRVRLALAVACSLRQRVTGHRPGLDAVSCLRSCGSLRDARTAWFADARMAQLQLV